MTTEKAEMRACGGRALGDMGGEGGGLEKSSAPSMVVSESKQASLSSYMAGREGGCRLL